MAQSGPNTDDLLDDFGDDFLSDEPDQDQADSTQTPQPTQAQTEPQAQPQQAQQQDDWLESTEVPGQLEVDVYQTKEDIVVRAPAPGVTKEDIDLSIVENTLTIRGEREKPEQDIRQSDYFVQEIYWGEFSRSVILPVQVQEEEAEAELKDGMLTIHIPKADQDKVKKIDIK